MELRIIFSVVCFLDSFTETIELKSRYINFVTMIQHLLYLPDSNQYSQFRGSRTTVFEI